MSFVQPSFNNTELEQKIWQVEDAGFEALALEVCRFQYQYNEQYRTFCDLLKRDVWHITRLEDIPFLPIAQFKNAAVKTTIFEPEAIFESSGTTGTATSKHYVRSLGLYEQSFLACFEKFYGKPEEYRILGLLPSYLERKHSSLLYMVNKLQALSKHADSGFYLYNHKDLAEVMEHMESKGQKTLLIGVTFALLDFAQDYPMPLQHTIVMETGGMKGRRREITRDEVHTILKERLSLPVIHSEYGMTELLSQAYAIQDGKFECPDWMKVLLRPDDDPLEVYPFQPGYDEKLQGVINVIDLANLYSCSFIATDDLGRLHPDGKFEVLGRLDNSDIRGCGLMLVN